MTTATEERAPEAATGSGGAEHHRVVVIGAGMAGIALGVRLRELGIDDFVLCERNEAIGGTWYEHTYPGCGCDIPTHLYSFSFARNPEWTRLFPRQGEILDYVQRIAHERGITERVRFGCTVEGADWDEARSLWHLHTSGGELTCDVLVSAIGAFSEPADPDLPGLEDFAGHRFHSARWDHEHDLAGERVAVIGTGPAAAQFVPRIQPEVAELVVFQRTPPWILPHPDRPVPGLERLAYRLLPPLQDLQRNAMFWGMELLGIGLRGRFGLISPIEALGRRHLRSQVSDPELRAKLEPDYRFGCKRPIMSNTWYPAIAAENATLVADAPARVESSEIVAPDGSRYEVDTIISASGYRFTSPEALETVRGVGGRTMSQLWEGSPRAYLGTTLPGFPNYFVLLGPNTVAVNSAVFSIEAQIEYVTDALKTMERKRLRRLELRDGILEDFVDEMDESSEGTVWTAGGCNAYYTDDEGRNFAIYPGFAAGFKHRTRRFDADRYELEPA